MDFKNKNKKFCVGSVWSRWEQQEQSGRVYESTKSEYNKK